MTLETPAPIDGVYSDRSVEDRAYGKVFWRIIPFLMLCYVVAYLDRVNVGFAKLQMSSELGLSEAAYGIGAGIFFIGYFLFEVPSNVILNKVGARVWIARIMITWGVISAAFMFTTSETVFYILRFLLGVAEAGFFPGIILYLTTWYPAHRRAKIITIFMSAIPISSIFGNPLSGLLMDSFHGTHGLSGWQWMFLIEAIPAIIFGIATFFYLDDTIGHAKWLSKEEKKLLAANIDAENRSKSSSPHSIKGTLTDPRVWLMCLIYFCFVLGQYGLNFWMPTLVKATGVTGNLNIGLISAIPYICTFVAMLALGRSSDRFRERRWHLVVPAVVAAGGFIAATMATSTSLAIVCLSLAAAGAISCAPLFWSLPTAFLAGTGAAAGIAWINSVGNLAGFLGPFLVGYLKDFTGSNSAGMYLLATALIIGSLAVLAVPAKTVNR
ncbi:MFS transporter [Sinorhizobium fredii USDA 205]|uniref:Putative tartrate transporter n=1 Tax=Rhizobium fredii TaxID=380 RepID=A0A844AC87_RHIFR|nr:MFS transporter [Sinorhizobium fredii]ASY72958.1 Nitrate/nitrite transporter [Sinorhizobium fredii CCBAU 83666]AWM29100.1 Nitrate/nitrite transporter [Sinorhizobium fredii CCBAU 25509]KSV85873.1 MFS transporter [Sinorhizobium fredii USDA 205]MQX09465.1 MFS transporter [Sinorhizobium fredii]GEC31243.1 MFS transporter [Sinorhizobium fredii]